MKIFNAIFVRSDLFNNSINLDIDLGFGHIVNKNIKLTNITETDNLNLADRLNDNLTKLLELYDNTVFLEITDDFYLEGIINVFKDGKESVNERINFWHKMFREENGAKNNIVN